jgi:hypothetical protein
VSRRAVLTRVGPLVVALVAVTAGLVVLTGSGDDDEARLLVERTTSQTTGEPELLVSAAGDAGKDPDVATEPGAVGLVCTDRSGRTTVTGRHPWPFAAEEGFDLPHVHQPAPAREVAATARCRLTGTREPIEGEVGGG